MSFLGVIEAADECTEQTLAYVTFWNWKLQKLRAIFKFVSNIYNEKVVISVYITCTWTNDHDYSGTCI